MAEFCAYCGEGDDLRPCPKCDRPVCWHPTCRASVGKQTLCCTCAGKLPETSEGNPDWMNGTCPICEDPLKFHGVVDVLAGDQQLIKVGKYECFGGHVVFVADYGNSRRL